MFREYMAHERQRRLNRLSPKSSLSHNIPGKLLAPLSLKIDKLEILQFGNGSNEYQEVTLPVSKLLGPKKKKRTKIQFRNINEIRINILCQ